LRRKVLDLVEAGRPIAEVVKALGISAQSISTWRRQDRIDRGLLPGLSSPEQEELAAARRRIAQLETELAVTPEGRAGDVGAAVGQQPVSVTTEEPARKPWRIMTADPAIDGH
jgi:transposase-like protein